MIQSWLQGKRVEVHVVFLGLCFVFGYGCFELAKVTAWMGVEGDLF